jgi:hypothetical protein
VTDRTRAEELYDTHRDKVWEDIKSGTESFDRNMLTLSSGALGLSLAFIKDIVPIGRTVFVPCLFASWTAFALCILVTLASFRISIVALEKTIPHLRKYYFENKVDSFDKHLDSLWTKAVDWCAYLGIFFFVAGMAFTMVFVTANIREANRMSKPETTTKVTIADFGKGAKSAAMTPTTVCTNDALTPAAMTPVQSGPEHRGAKPAGMTPSNTEAGHKPVPMSPAPTQSTPTQSVPPAKK